MIHRTSTGSRSVLSRSASADERRRLRHVNDGVDRVDSEASPETVALLLSRASGAAPGAFGAACLDLDAHCTQRLLGGLAAAPPAAPAKPRALRRAPPPNLVAKQTVIREEAGSAPPRRPPPSAAPPPACSRRPGREKPEELDQEDALAQPALRSSASPAASKPIGQAVRKPPTFGAPSPAASRARRRTRWFAVLEAWNSGESPAHVRGVRITPPDGRSAARAGDEIPAGGCALAASRRNRGWVQRAWITPRPTRSSNRQRATVTLRSREPAPCAARSGASGPSGTSPKSFASEAWRIEYLGTATTTVRARTWTKASPLPAPPEPGVWEFRFGTRPVPNR